MSTLYLIRHGQASYGVADYDQLSPLGVKQAQAIGVALGGSPLHARPLAAIYAGPLKRQRDTAMHLREAAATAGRALPELTFLDELSEYPAFELLRHFIPRLVEEDPAFAALAGKAPEPAGQRSQREPGRRDDDRPAMIKLLDLAFENIIGRWARGTLEPIAGVESFADFAARVQRGLETITRAHGKGARVAAVTSGGVIAVALKLALDFDHARTLEHGRLVRNASISEFAYRSQGFAWRPGDFSLVGFNHVEHLGALDMITFR